MLMIHFPFHAMTSTQTVASGLSPLTEPMPESTIKSLLEGCVLLFAFEVSCLAPTGQSILSMIWLLFGLFSAPAAAAASGTVSVGVTVMLGMGLWGTLALDGVVGGVESRTSTE